MATITYNTSRRSSLISALNLLTWRRHRKQSTWMFGYVLLAVIAIHMYPIPNFIVEIGSSLIYAIIALSIAIFFSNTESSIGAAQSSYPSDLLIRPVETKSLALAPMLACAATLAFFWMVFEYFVLLPNGCAFTFKQALAAIAFANWVQALSWVPASSDLKNVKGFVYTIVVLSLLGGFVLMIVNKVPEFIFWVIAIPIIVAAYPVTIHGLTILRCGDALSWPNRRKLQYNRNTHQRTVLFVDWKQALQWSIWKEETVPWIMQSLGVNVIALIGSIFVYMITVYKNIPVRIPISPAAQNGWLAIHCDITSYILLTILIGYCLSAINLWRTPDKWMRSSIAVLPITSQDLIGARYKAEWIRIIISIISSGVFVLAALLIPAEYHDKIKPFGYLLWTLIPVSQKLIMAAYFVVIIAGISLNRIVSTLICFRLQRDIKKIIVIIFTAIGILSVYLFVLLFEYGLSSSPQGQTLFHKHIYAYLTNGWPHLLGFIVAVKLILTVWAVYLLKQSNALSMQIKAAGAIIWLIVYTSYIVLAWYKIPPVSFWYIAGLMYLFMPTVRLCIAPVNLDWNRHR